MALSSNWIVGPRWLTGSGSLFVVSFMESGSLLVGRWSLSWALELVLAVAVAPLLSLLSFHVEDDMAIDCCVEQLA
jgi:hypothetical protein